jgi:alginate O-acetyltransferase complex protein AlgI
MVFSSPIFLFLFLPITLFIYFLIPKSLKNTFLFIASLLFYAWGELAFVYVMLASIVLNYTFARLINYFRNKILGAFFFLFAITLNLASLIYFKYFNFLLTSAGFNYDESITLPLGISFFTFHALSYIIDVYREKSLPQKNFVNLGLYISNFSQLVAGPIIRYPDISDQLDERSLKSSDIVYGIRRFVIGMAKKVLVANTMAEIADRVFGSDLPHLDSSLAWLGLICYALQIYYDFSGYSDMAIGLGRIFGFHFLENFNYPYAATSVRDFWRRWHISLSNWFRDYVYIPMGGSYNGTARTYLNLLTIFILCGLWHGANWTFVIWGLWYGFFLILERTQLGIYFRKLPVVFQHTYTILVVLVGWVFFRSESVNAAIQYLKIMISLPNLTDSINWTYYLDADIVLALIIGIIGAAPLLPWLSEKISEKHKDSNGYLLIYNSCLILIFLLSILSLASGTYNPFIYFKF